MHDKKLYGTATVGTKGQIVIPAEAREELGIQPGDRLYVVGSTDKGICALLKQETIEHHIAHLASQLENFKTIQEKEV